MDDRINTRRDGSAISHPTTISDVCRRDALGSGASQHCYTLSIGDSPAPQTFAVEGNRVLCQSRSTTLISPSIERNRALWPPSFHVYLTTCAKISSKPAVLPLCRIRTPSPQIPLYTRKERCRSHQLGLQNDACSSPSGDIQRCRWRHSYRTTWLRRWWERPQYPMPVITESAYPWSSRILTATV